MVQGPYGGLLYPYGYWGPLVGVRAWKIDLALYWMNPGHSTDEYVSATLNFSF